MSRTMKREPVKKNINFKASNKAKKKTRREVYLVNWSEIEESLNDDYVSYDSLLESDAEFLKLTSLNYDELCW
jgi:hypothetical protein